ncbi:hypothetical protein [Oleisolibacter albus]|uniref:hypothetical protein n=1 Tax=Oleisolibacter albus TaxID=2171757 RepID=UPI000DF17A9C|nr:hypothetical protein [Oleisolibacter albus]
MTTISGGGTMAASQTLGSSALSGRSGGDRATIAAGIAQAEARIDLLRKEQDQLEIQARRALKPDEKAAADTRLAKKKKELVEEQKRLEQLHLALKQAGGDGADEGRAALTRLDLDGLTAQRQEENQQRRLAQGLPTAAAAPTAGYSRITLNMKV